MNSSTIDILVESEEHPLSLLIEKFFDTELPLPVYDNNDRSQEIGTIMFLELLEKDNGVHVLRGGLVNNPR